jgi:p-aminobenzoyl-glutamate transporter AbgT
MSSRCIGAAGAGVLSSSVAFAAIDAFLLGALGAVVTAPFAATLLLALLGWHPAVA